MTATTYSTPTADWLTVSCAKSDLVPLLDSTRSVFSGVPGATALDGGSWQFQSGGHVRVSTRGLVGIVSCSGAALVELRAASLFRDYLWSLAEFPHRVTRLDAALDVAKSAPPILADLYARGVAGGIRLTHKPCPVRKYVGVDSNGAESGTVYLGAKQAKVKARVYDKRLERLERRGSDPGPLTRYELTGCSEVGVSLRDAADPAPFFWHFMSNVLAKPSSVPAWVPGGVGFDLPARPMLTPLQVLDRRLSFSTELSDIAKHVLATPGGVWHLRCHLRKLGIDFSPDSMLVS